MKKTYFAPSVKVMEIKGEELICMSLKGTATDAEVLSRERGTRQKSETIFDEELW